jgi:hypothetical protein
MVINSLRTLTTEGRAVVPAPTLKRATFGYIER